MIALCWTANVRCFWPEQRQSIQCNNSSPFFFCPRSLWGGLCSRSPFSTCSRWNGSLFVPHPFVPFVVTDRGPVFEPTTRPLLPTLTLAFFDLLLSIRFLLRACVCACACVCTYCDYDSRQPNHVATFLSFAQPSSTASRRLYCTNDRPWAQVAYQTYPGDFFGRQEHQCPDSCDTANH